MNNKVLNLLHIAKKHYGFLRICRLQNARAIQLHKQAGFTLLELLVVVSLLGALALGTTALLIEDAGFKRADESEQRWDNFRKAIVGESNQTLNGVPDFSGFATDMGRLPNCLRELIRPFDCTSDLSAANKLNAFSQDIDSNQWFGWRGPYLGVLGANEYRDGWRNMGRDDNTGNDDDVNYGWLFGTGAANGTACQDAVVTQQQPGAIIIQSCGDGGKVDNTESGLNADYPYVEVDGIGNPIYIPSVTRHDYQVDMGAGWNEVPIKFKSTKVSQSRIIPASSIRLRMNYPVADGRIPDWTDLLIDDSAKRDNSPFLSTLFPANAKRLVDATGKVYTGADVNSDGLTDIIALAADVTVPSGTTLTATLLTIPNSATSTLVFSDNSEIALQNCPCEIEVNAGTLSATVLSGATTIAIKPEYIAPITADIGKYMIEVSQATIGSGTSFTLPNGATLTLNAAADDAYFPKLILSDTAGPPTVTVSATFTVEGDLVETDLSGDQFIIPSTSTDAGNVITVAKTAPTIPKGLRSITIVCEVDGLLFDGNCSDGYDPIAIPYKLNVSPRSYIPLPDEIIWNIK